MKSLLITLLAFLCLNAKAQKNTILINYNDDTKQAWYQEVISVDTSLKKAEIYKRVKQWSASVLTSNSLQMNYQNEEEGKMIFNLVQSLYIHQGFGQAPYEVKYTYTIDVKDSKYRYRVDNVEFGYKTIIGNIGKRETLYSEWIKSEKGKYYDNDLKRIVSFQDHIKMQTDLLLQVVNNSVKKSDNF